LREECARGWGTAKTLADASHHTHLDLAALAAATAASVREPVGAAVGGTTAGAAPGAVEGGEGRLTEGVEAGGDGRSGRLGAAAGATFVYTSTMQYRVPKGCMTTGAEVGSAS
jgi:hypothetical protein